MKFTFAFEKLLDHKRKLEDVARRDYFEARGKVEDGMRKLTELFKQIDDARKRASGLEIKGGTSAPALGQIDEFISGQKLRIERHRADLRVLMAESERLQEVLIEAAKEKKTLDKLKERRLEEYKIRRKKSEMKEADEFVVTRFKRKDV